MTPPDDTKPDAGDLARPTPEDALRTLAEVACRLNDIADLMDRPEGYADSGFLRKTADRCIEATQTIGRAIKMPDAPGLLDWQPIETAPKDGTMILAGRNQAIDLVRWGEEWNGMNWLDAGGHVIGRPTHWMPLPAPP